MRIVRKYDNIDFEQPIRSLLELRGVEDYTRWLMPTEDALLDPSKLKNVDKGIDLLLEKINSKILIVVDSDADGYCSAAVLRLYLGDIQKNLNCSFVCHETKAHGLEDIYKEYNLDEFDLVILPDAGTNDAKYFNQCNTDFLVLDHHLPSEGFSEEDSPRAVIVNNQLSDEYSNKDLSGAGVVWQFCRRMDERLGKNFAGKYMDLVAVALVADMMDSKTLENRYIIKKGLENITNPLLQVMVEAQAFKLNGRVTPTGFAFYIIPLINSICRTGTMDEKRRVFEGFIDGDRTVFSNKRGSKGEEVPLSEEVVREATNARSRQKRKEEKALEYYQLLIKKQDLDSNRIILLAVEDPDEDFPSEINGLVANRLTKIYNKPALVLKITDEVAKGSGRGLETLDMPPFRTFLLSSGFFNFAEGHENAFGCSINEGRIADFLAWSNEELKHLEDMDNIYEVDFLIDPEIFDLEDFIHELDLYEAIWGPKNKTPLIGLRLDVHQGNVKVIGKNNNTVKITKDGIAYMFFNQSQREVKDFLAKQYFSIDIVGEANLNEYYNNLTPQIMVTASSIRNLDF